MNSLRSHLYSSVFMLGLDLSFVPIYQFFEVHGCIYNKLGRESLYCDLGMHCVLAFFSFLLFLTYRLLIYPWHWDSHTGEI